MGTTLRITQHFNLYFTLPPKFITKLQVRKIDPLFKYFHHCQFLKIQTVTFEAYWSASTSMLQAGFHCHHTFPYHSLNTSALLDNSMMEKYILFFPIFLKLFFFLTKNMFSLSFLMTVLPTTDRPEMFSTIYVI